MIMGELGKAGYGTHTRFGTRVHMSEAVLAYPMPMTQARHAKTKRAWSAVLAVPLASACLPPRVSPSPRVSAVGTPRLVALAQR